MPRRDVVGRAAEHVAHAVAAGFLSLMRALASVRPLIIAVDDVQWLDPPSRGVLEFAARRLDSETIGLLYALRAPASLDPLARVVPRERLRRVHLGGLSLAALGRIIAAGRRRLVIGGVLASERFTARVTPQGGPNLLPGRTGTITLAAAGPGTTELLACARGRCIGTVVNVTLVTKAGELLATLTRGRSLRPGDRVRPARSGAAQPRSRAPARPRAVHGHPALPADDGHAAADPALSAERRGRGHRRGPRPSSKRASLIIPSACIAPGSRHLAESRRVSWRPPARHPSFVLS